MINPILNQVYSIQNVPGIPLWECPKFQGLKLSAQFRPPPSPIVLCLFLDLLFQYATDPKVHVPDASKRPLFKTSEFGIRKVLLIEKAPNQEDRDLRFFKSILSKPKFQASFKSREGKMRGFLCKNSSPKQNSSNNQHV